MSAIRARTGNMATLTETLISTSLFDGFDTDDIENVASQTVIRQFPKNTVIVSQGDDTDSFYVILQGKVDVFLHNDKGKGNHYQYPE